MDSSTKELKNLTSGSGLRCSSLLPAKESNLIAFVARPNSIPTSQLPKVYISSQNDVSEIALCENSLNNFVEDFVWKTNNILILAMRYHGEVTLFAADLETKSLTHLGLSDYTITGLSSCREGNIYFTAFHSDGSHELYKLDSDNKPIALTHFNQNFLEETERGDFEKITYTSFDGILIEGWLLKPQDFDASQKYPLATNVHGGPSLMYGPSTPTLWLEWQHHVANGYVVFFCNPRGSTGYGEQFVLANHQDWGDSPMKDIIAGVEHVIKMGFIDDSRLVITGGSYGGFLTTWIIAHDNRFSSAIVQRGPYNLFSFHGTTDIPLFVSANMLAEPWENPSLFWEQSPITYTSQIKTPLLIIHSENDTRVPISEAYQLFTMLKRQNKNVQLVVYPNSDHELSRSGKPKFMKDRLDRIIDWWNDTI